MSDDSVPFAMIGFWTGAAIVFFIMLALRPNTQEPGYGRTWKCDRIQVVHVDSFGYVKGKPCRSVHK